MELTINGILDSIILFKSSQYVIYGKDIEEKKLKEKTKIFEDNIKDIIMKLNYNILKCNNGIIQVKNDDSEKIKIKYNIKCIKQYESYYPKISLNINFKIVSSDLLLLIDNIYLYFKAKSKYCRQWEVIYKGKTNNTYLIKNDDVKIIADSIVLKYNTNKESNISEILEKYLMKN